MFFYLVIFSVLAVLSVVYFKLADKYNIVDKPNHRSSHTQNTIRGGGVVFFFALVLYFIWSGGQFPLLFLGALLIGVLSFIDDLKPLPPSLRFPVQLLTAVLVLIELDLGLHFLLFPFLVIVIVAFINAFNFMDGINGITGMYALVFFISLLSIQQFYVAFIPEQFLLFFIFSLLVFAFYNFRVKALMFAGDVGSITLAVCMSFCVLMLYKATKAPVVILLLAVYGIDTFLTIVRRVKMREKITDAHRHHLYQRIVDSKRYSHLSTSVIYAIMQLLVNIIVFAFLKSEVQLQWITVLIVLVILSVIYFVALGSKTFNTLR